MKKIWKGIVIMLGLLIFLFSGAIMSATTSLTKQEIEDIMHMREEEKLARDVYTTLYNIYKVPIFNNISKSEQTHMNAVKTLIERYNLDDPVKDNTVGKFTNPEFTKLYATLVERGKNSLKEALTVGTLIEDLDIKDLKEAMNRTNKTDIKIVYNNLLNGSKNHLRSFISQLQRYSQTYTPTYISKEELTEIISGK